MTGQPPVGGTIFAKGIMTQASAIAGLGRHDVERRVGFNAGHLAQGFSVAHLAQVPGVNGWTFRRYTDLMRANADATTEEAFAPDTRSAEDILTDEGYDVPAMKAEVTRYTFATSGPNRLIKIIPVINPDGWPQYPERAGAPQWVLLAPQAMTVAGFVGPQDTYTPFP